MAAGPLATWDREIFCSFAHSDVTLPREKARELDEESLAGSNV